MRLLLHSCETLANNGFSVVSKERWSTAKILNKEMVEKMCDARQKEEKTVKSYFDKFVCGLYCTQAHTH
jgi:hypothetical protein